MFSYQKNHTEDFHTCLAIDLKSFYASVEASARHYDPLATNLVVADESRTEKTICLAVSPSLKEHGISGRARLFEVIQRVKEVNEERLRTAIRLGVAVKDPETGKYRLGAPSFDAAALKADPSLELSYIIAPPRMKLYQKVSTQIFSIYMNYVSSEDIHVYSIDECFMDVTGYLAVYGISAHDLAMKMIREVLTATGITATAGIGTNLYLAKIAMDIVAKHVPADAQGVRIAELNERTYRELLWSHTPLTDFWRVGRGTAKRLADLGCFTMGDVARLSLHDESRLYKAFGVNAELLIDHAWGWEPTDIATIKSYRPENQSVSSGQVLPEPYEWESGKLIVREMTELLALDLVRKGVVTKQVSLTVNYDRTSILPADSPELLSTGRSSGSGRSAKAGTYIVAKTGKKYAGTVSTDHYGRPCPKYAHGTENLDHYTSSARLLAEAMMTLYDRITDPDLTIRRVNISANNIIPEDQIPPEMPEQLTLFTDYEALEKERAKARAAEEKEKRMQKATLLLQQKYGKNAVLKGMNLMDGGKTIERNRTIGGHRAGETDSSGSSHAELSAPSPDPGSPPAVPSVPKQAPDPVSEKTYADIISLPHRQSPDRPHMSLYDRAAQFGSYKALTGYEDMVADEARRHEFSFDDIGERKEQPHLSGDHQ